MRKQDKDDTGQHNRSIHVRLPVWVWGLLGVFSSAFVSGVGYVANLAGKDYVNMQTMHLASKTEVTKLSQHVDENTEVLATNQRIMLDLKKAIKSVLGNQSTINSQLAKGSPGDNSTPAINTGAHSGGK